MIIHRLPVGRQWAHGTETPRWKQSICVSRCVTAPLKAAVFSTASGRSLHLSVRLDTTALSLFLLPWTNNLVSIHSSAIHQPTSACGSGGSLQEGITLTALHLRVCLGGCVCVCVFVCVCVVGDCSLPASIFFFVFFFVVNCEAAKFPDKKQLILWSTKDVF